MKAYEESLNQLLTAYKKDLKQMQDNFMNRVQYNMDDVGFEKSAIADLTAMADIKSKIQSVELSLILLNAHVQ